MSTPMIYNDVQHIAQRLTGLVLGQFLEDRLGFEERLSAQLGDSDMAKIAIKALSLYASQQGTDMALDYYSSGKLPSLSSAFDLGVLESYLSVVLTMYVLTQTGVLDSIIPDNMGQFGRYTTAGIIYMVAEEIASKAMPMLSNMSVGY